MNLLETLGRITIPHLDITEKLLILLNSVDHKTDNHFFLVFHGEFVIEVNIFITVDSWCTFPGTYLQPVEYESRTYVQVYTETFNSENKQVDFKVFWDKKVENYFN